MRPSVNVSALQFRQPGLRRRRGRRARSGRPGHLLDLELTESILIQDAQDSLARMQALARLGVRLAIDDFGTGYSSLGYLKRVPLHQLKIDRSFIDGPPGDDDVAIVRAIVDIGRALRLQVIAEGVETERSGCSCSAPGATTTRPSRLPRRWTYPDFERRDRPRHARCGSSTPRRRAIGPGARAGERVRRERSRTRSAWSSTVEVGGRRRRPRSEGMALADSATQVTAPVAGSARSAFSTARPSMSELHVEQDEVGTQRPPPPGRPHPSRRRRGRCPRVTPAVRAPAALTASSST